MAGSPQSPHIVNATSRSPLLASGTRCLRADAPMRETMAPHLQAMLKEIAAAWPELDPELLLVYWLCERHHLDPPKISLAKRSIPQPPLLPRQRALVTGNIELPPLERTSKRPAAGTAGPVSTHPLDEVTLPAQAAGIGTSVPFAATDGSSSARRAETPPAFRDPVGLREKLRNHRQEPNLLQLARVDCLMKHDKEAYADRIAKGRAHAEAIHGQVALMRHQLRGKFLASVPLLSDSVLNPEEQLRLSGKLKPLNFTKGDIIMKEGDIGTQLFIIERGECEIWKTIDDYETRICSIDRGSFFGELATIYDMPRAATVIASSDVTLLSLSRDDIFATLSKERINAIKVVVRAQVFSSIPVFKGLSVACTTELAKSLKVDTWKPHAVIQRENEQVHGPSRRMYILEKGKCRVSIMQADRKEKTWAVNPSSQGKNRISRGKSVFMQDEKTVLPGCFWGVMETFYGCPKQSTVTVSSSPVTTLSSSYDEMKELYGNTAEQVLGSMKRSVRMGLLEAAHSMLKTVPEEELNRLLDSASTQTCVQWETLFTKGDYVDALFILEAGRFIEYDGEAEVLQEHTFSSVECLEHDSPGDTFGTRSTIGMKAAIAPFTILAISQSTVLRVPFSSFRTLPTFKEVVLPTMPNSCSSQTSSPTATNEGRVLGLLRPGHSRILPEG